MKRASDEEPSRGSKRKKPPQENEDDPAKAPADESEGEVEESKPESATSEEERKLAEKRAYNRRNAARARQRVKDQLADLSQKVESYADKNSRLQSQNEQLASQVKLLSEENQRLRQVVAAYTGSSAPQFLGSMLSSTSQPPSITDPVLTAQQRLLLAAMQQQQQQSLAGLPYAGNAFPPESKVQEGSQNHPTSLSQGNNPSGQLPLPFAGDSELQRALLLGMNSATQPPTPANAAATLSQLLSSGARGQQQQQQQQQSIAPSSASSSLPTISLASQLLQSREFQQQQEPLLGRALQEPMGGGQQGQPMAPVASDSLEEANRQRAIILSLLGRGQESKESQQSQNKQE